LIFFFFFFLLFSTTSVQYRQDLSWSLQVKIDHIVNELLLPSN
jgi:hypothetical protein